MRRMSGEAAWKALVMSMMAGCALVCGGGCASPGPPRAPSLRLPAPVKDLSAERSGGAVTLHFTVPQRTTDKLPIREPVLGLQLCREVDHGQCEPVTTAPKNVSVNGVNGTANAVTLQDVLPPALATGPARLLTYRVTMLNGSAHSAGPSDAAYTVAGAAPAEVKQFAAAGSRLGVLLTWAPEDAASGEVILQRTDQSKAAAQKSATAKPGQKNDAVLLLKSNEASGQAAGRTLDADAADDVPYRYVAYRQQQVQLGGRTLTMRSAESPGVEFVLHDTFPPPTPTEVTAAGFTDAAGAFAVDLIWQPVDDPGLAGYNVYRDGVKLNAAAVQLPSFHDATAKADVSYKYGVTAVDRKGNESVAGVVEAK